MQKGGGGSDVLEVEAFDGYYVVELEIACEQVKTKE